MYPLVMLSGITGFLFLQSIYPNVIWIAYIPVLFATICVTGLEIIIPHNRNWLPNSRDIKTDIVYMLFVQVGVPLILGLGLVSLLHAPLSNVGSQLSEWWPHHWSVLAQGVVMLLTAEFFSYWLHRFAHKIPALWRLHAVHHSPEKLYWLNVGRFHPLEKVLQYAVSTFPFMLLGVSQDVLGLYFVFYGINGFFQHSNIKIKYGVLNYLISSATLHRWHHSPNINESNHNYGNNLIIWDLLFGTWFLPSGRHITKVGSGIEKYPQSFTKQLVKPFERVTNTDCINFRTYLNKLLLNVMGGYLNYRYWKPFVNNARNPEKKQNNTLKGILRKNVRTHLGHSYGFSEIKDVKTFKQNVPIMQYEDIESLIKEQTSTGNPVLHSNPALFYARTSGTTGSPKDIPITKSAVLQFKRQQRLLTSYQYQICPDAFTGKALGVVSPAIEGHLDSGMSYGSVSGYIYKTMPAFIRNRYIVPAEVFDITDYELKYRVITRLALAQSDITYLGTANPSTFLRIREVLNDEWDIFLSSLVTGELTGIEKLSDSLRNLLNEKIKPEPGRYRELKSLSSSCYIEYKDVWPSIRMVTTWTGGNCQVALEQLKASLPQATKIIELGYVASELRATLTVDPFTNAGLPILDQVYYEFIEKDDWDNGQRETLSITQLKEGKRYYIIVTTNYGLYRYFMNDLIEVCQMYMNTPLLKFSQKGNGVTNITGEKVYETQINEAIHIATRGLDLKANFNLTLANVLKARYEIYLELRAPFSVNIYVLSHAIDKCLSDINIEYCEKRKSARLLAPRVYIINSNTSKDYKKYQIDRGQREGQYKIVTLLNKHDCGFPLHNYFEEEVEGGQYASYC